MRFAAARRGRSSTTRRSSAVSRRRRGRSTAPSADPRAHRRGVLDSRSPGGQGRSCLALPEDVLAEEADVADGTRVESSGASSRSGGARAASRACSPRAERPLVVVGEGGWTAGTSRDVQAFCEANDLPVACAFRCQDFVDNRSPSYVGVLGVAMDEAIAARLRATPTSCCAIGGRLGEVPTRRYTPSSRRIRGRRSSASIPIPDELWACATSQTSRSPRRFTEFAAALRALDPMEPALARVDACSARRLRGEPAARADGGRRRPRGGHGVPPRNGSQATRSQTCGAGNFTVWAHRFAEFTRVRHAGVSAERVDGVRAPGRGRRAADPLRSASSSASPATATSS